MFQSAALVFAVLVCGIAAQTTAPPLVSTLPSTTTSARPTLPPFLAEKVCRDLIPLHQGSPGPQNTTSPYRITTDIVFVRNGQTLNLTISGEKLNGFMVQARPAHDYTIYRTHGFFKDFPGYNYNLKTDCLSDGDTAFSDTPESWPAVSVEWTAPTSGSGEIIFFASITKDFNQFWINLFSVGTVRYGPN